MTIDFRLIDNEEVGFNIRDVDVPYKGWFKDKVFFKQFKIPYLETNENYKQVQNNLRHDLMNNYSKQEIIQSSDISELLQERGMLMKSISLIEQNYPQFL